MNKDQRCNCGANSGEGHLITCPQSPANLPSKQQLENANVLWQEVDRQLKAGIGVPSITLNQVHWRAAIEEVERAREKAAKRADKIHELRATFGRILSMSVTMGEDSGHVGIEAECRKALEITPVETVGDDARDAARYRFLREPGNAIVYAKDRNAWGKNASGHVRWDTAEQLDAAVDAARGAVEPSLPLVTDRAQGTDCPYCEDDVPHRHAKKATAPLSTHQAVERAIERSKDPDAKWIPENGSAEPTK